jgi:hypothetical protein
MNTDFESARQIGWRYLEASPEERDAVWADPRIMELVATLGNGSGDLGALCRQAAVQQKADFESGDVVSVNGWLLSRAEARLCAACALVSG